MLSKVDKMIIGGAMANTFLKSQGFQVGASKVEDDLLANRERGEALISIAHPDFRPELRRDFTAIRHFLLD